MEEKTKGGYVNRGIRIIKNRPQFFPAWEIREKAWAKTCTAISLYSGNSFASAAENMKNIVIEVCKK